MYEIFAKLLAERGLTAYRVSVETGVSQTTLSDWKHGRSRPKLEKLQKLADYLGVSLACLTGSEEPPAQPTDEQIKRALFGDIDVTDEVYEQVKAYARFVTRQQDK